MAVGIWVLNVFAALWATVGLLLIGAPRPALVTPAAAGAALGWLCTRALPAPAAEPAGLGAHVGRVVGIWSAVEAVLIFAATFTLRRSGRPNLILPAVGLIVGLHFLPLAHDLPNPPYYATGAAMALLCLTMMALSPPRTGPITAFGCATILWITSLAMAFA